MTDRDAMIEAVAMKLRAHLDLRLFVRRQVRAAASAALEVLEPFMQAREQAAREEGRKQEREEIVAWLRSDAAKWQHPLTDNAMAVTADAIERNEHREQQDG